MKRTLLAISILVFNMAAAQTIDTTFGNNGMVISELTQQVDALHAMALQPDGKIVALGFAGNKLAITRYEASGAPDTSFGTGGVMVSNFICGFGYPFDLALQTDGKILVLGKNNGIMLIARYNANGTPDTAFGINGVVSVSTDTGAIPFCSAMELLDDGKILITGIINIDKIYVGRFTPDGDADVDFGTNGYTITPIGTDFGSAYVEDIATQADGSSFVIADLSNTSGYNDFSLFKYDSNGLLDINFGTGGFVRTDIGGANVADNPGTVKVLPDGKILLSGTSGLNFAMARYNANGTLDTTFNTTGIVTTYAGGSYRLCADMLLQPDGKIVLAGYIGDDFASIRYNANGTPDTPYGTNGIYEIDFGTSYDYGNAIIRQPDGKLIMGGWTSFFCSDRAFGLIRFSTTALSTDELGIGDGISVYPNPSNAFIHIKSNHNIMSVLLYDIQGRMLQATVENTTEAVLDISGKQNGVYFLQITTEYGCKTEKIVKQ